MDTPHTIFETLPYRIASSQYFSVILRRIVMQWLGITILLLAILIGATCFDVRFGVVLLMFIFIILPLILFIFYYNYALRPEAFYSVVEKSVIIHNNGIDCIYNEKQRNILSWNNVQRIERDSKAFYFYTGKYTFFYLCRDAFTSTDEMHEFEKNFLPNILS